MTHASSTDPTELLVDVKAALSDGALPELRNLLSEASQEQLTGMLEHLPPGKGAVTYRLLPKDQALEVFEAMSPAGQRDLITALQDAEVASIFAELDPEFRVQVMDELPASVAQRLLQGLSADQRQQTAVVLGYPRGSVGRRMSSDHVAARADATVAEALDRLRARIDDAETIYTMPVVDHSRRVVGVVSLRDLMRADPTVSISELMREPDVVSAYADAEHAAREFAKLRLLTMPVVDQESRLVGILTTDDVFRILEDEESEDSARQGGVEPLRRPYLATPIRSLVKSRIVWLLVLAIGATLTVQVLEIFESTLEQVTVLALFIPLLIGIGGNTGNQAATTVTRALALGDVRARDVGRVLAREFGAGLSLGILLGLLGGVIVGLIYDWHLGVVIALTLVSICTMAASVGGIMPLIARSLKVDPAVFSNPFISTFVDAMGLVLYFLIAGAVLQF